MDNGYRAITEEEGAIVEAGDEYRHKLDRAWRNLESCIGLDYDDEMNFRYCEYRRPIAHYATPTDKIVEHALDATSNAPDEWPSETGDKVLYSIESHEQDEVNAIHDALLNRPEGHDTAQWIYTQCYQKERTISKTETVEWDGKLEVCQYYRLTEPLVLGGCREHIELEKGDKVYLSGYFDYGFGKVCIVNESAKRDHCMTIVERCLEPIETQSQIEEREREEFALSAVKASKDYSFGGNLTAGDARQIYDWLKSTDQLKDKSDE